MKKKLLWIFLSLLIVVSGYCIYQEAHFHMTTNVPAQMSEAQILKELPDIAISDTDKALRQAILDLPQIQDYLQKASCNPNLESLSIAFSTVQAQLEPHLPEGWEKIMELAITAHGRIYFSVSCGPKKAVYYEFSTDDSHPIQKMIGIYHLNHKGQIKNATIYSNTGTVIQKLVEKRIWFAWLHSDN